jgi:competence ComEA-like helix-hairpin-helix protein
MNCFILLRTIFLILLLPPKPLPHQSDPQNSEVNKEKSYVVLTPLRDSTDGYPVLSPISHTDPRVPLARQLFETTFIREMIPMNDSVIQNLNSEGMLYEHEPLYLLLSGKMGGFPRKGFYLLQGGEILDKTGTPYVDLATIDENYARLSSITQIFPHELAHIFYRQLTRNDPEQSTSFSSDIHYFSIVTDYEKAFSEGYAESYENLARLHEPNKTVKEGIQADIKRLRKYLPPNIKGLERDFFWPCRVGYYRMTMVLWFQQLEDFKRYIWALNGKAKYQPSSHPLNRLSVIKDPGSRISFRNACVSYDSTRLLTPAQAVSTEGVISSFFTLLRGETPPEICLPKEFLVIHKYLHNLPVNSSPLQAFVNGYIHEFPAERDRVLKAWYRASGTEYQDLFIPELWILNAEYNHNYWVMAQYGGATLPFYTINLNTTRCEDLITIPGISPEDAGRIIAYRDSVGWFSTFEELKTVHGISKETASKIIHNQLIPDMLERMEYEAEFGLWELVCGTLKQLLFVSIVITLIITTILYFLFYLRKKSLKETIRMFIRSWFKGLLFLLAGLAALILPQQSVFLVMGFALFIVVLNLVRTRRNLIFRREILISTLILSFYIIYSVL